MSHRKGNRFIGFCVSVSITSLAALALLMLTVPALAAPDQGVPGQIMSQGAKPFSDTWKAMRKRDASAGKSPSGKPDFIPRKKDPRFSTRTSVGGSAVEQERSLPVMSSPQAVGTNFQTINLQDQFNAFGGGSIPPDTMGAIGPSHFMEVINSSVAIYDRVGNLQSHVRLNTFFTVVVGGTTYPRNGAFDPRVLFDRRSDRWFAIALERGNPSGQYNHIILAVCRTNDPTTGTWDKYVIGVGAPNQGAVTYFSDYDTLGIDDNGVYFAVSIFGSNSSFRSKIAATGKASLIAATPTLGAVSTWDSITDMYSTPQPTQNYDGVAGTSPAWFVSGSPTVYADVHYRTLTWSGGTPTLSGTSTVVSTSAYAAPINAPVSGSTTNIDVGDDRLMMSMIRNNRLWTCRNVGVNSSGGNTSADRTACEWLELDVSGAPATLAQSGRVYDTAASSPRYYYYPSIVVNGQGHAAMGFSGSKSSEYIAAYTCGRLAGDAAGAMGAPTQIKSGDAAYTRLDAYSRNRWGDYSFTSIDPNDDMTIWTIQEYASNAGTNTWGTWVAALMAPQPVLMPPLPTPSYCAGTFGNMLTLNGINFYDPGPGYASRLGVMFQGMPGVLVTGVAWMGPAMVNVFFDIMPNTTAGPQNIMLTNPDGQIAFVPNGINILAGPTIVDQTRDLTACLGQPDVICVNATGTPPITYQWTQHGMPIPGATGSCYIIPSATCLDMGVYQCMVTGTCGTVPSMPIPVQVTGPPQIMQQPENRVACMGEMVSFCVGAFAECGGGIMNYQWRKDWIDIPGANSPCYDTIADPMSAGAYTCLISNQCGVAVSAEARLGVGPCIEKISQVKHAPDGFQFVIKGKVVTAAFTNYFYIEETDASKGIRAEETSHGLSIGDAVDIQGTIQTNTYGERYIDVQLVAKNGSGTVVPLLMTNRDLGGADWQYNSGNGAGQQGVLNGAGLNNIGLLVTSTGAFTYVSSTRFTVDDGSIGGVTVDVPSTVTLDSGWQYVTVTGISSCRKPGSDVLRWLLVRQQSDITHVP